jgi:hypothetical protein
MSGQSRATISIRASVMPRFRLDEPPQQSARLDSFGLLSNAPSLRVHLVDAPQQLPRPDADDHPGGGAEASSAEIPRLVLIVPD